jgi:hypothetical protein
LALCFDFLCKAATHPPASKVGNLG